MAPKAGGRAGSLSRRRASPKRTAAKASAATASAVDPAAAPATHTWPPKVPLGPIDDVLPMIAADDEDLDTLMLPPPGALGDTAAAAYGPEECGYICKCLKTNRTVTTLNISFNPIGDQGIEEIAALLDPTNDTGPDLFRVLLNGCSVGNRGAQAVAVALADNKTLQVLELSNNGIEEEGGKALLDMLKRNRTIKQLQLSLNPISEDLQAQISKQLMIR